MNSPLPEPGIMRADTRKVLRTGAGIFLVGAVAVLLTETLLGGIGRQGPHTNLGWLGLMLAMGCLPTGTLTLLLGVAKLSADRKR